MHTTRYVSLLLLLASACATAGYSRSSPEPAAMGNRPDSMVVILAGVPSGGSAATTAVAARTKALADRRRRAELRGAKVFGREVLASADLVRAADFVRRVAGAEVTEIDPSKSWVTLRTCRVRGDVPTVFVDGTRVGDPIGVLNMFMATELEMVEVYRGIAQLPPEVNEGCSAVFLWTRRSVAELAPAP